MIIFLQIYIKIHDKITWQESCLSYYVIMSNKYKKHSKISEAKFREIVRLFILDIEATKIAAITRLSRNTINSIINGIRKRISQYCETQSPFPKREIEIDESYFSARRVRGK